jgi:hypothetical protein
MREMRADVADGAWRLQIEANSWHAITAVLTPDVTLQSSTPTHLHVTATRQAHNLDDDWGPPCMCSARYGFTVAMCDFQAKRQSANPRVLNQRALAI